MDERKKLVVFDTSVLVSAARSTQGASYALLSRIPSPSFRPCLSMSLYLEWQEVMTRPENIPPGLTADDAVRYLRYLANQSYLQDIHYLWRPFLADPDDDMVLELPFASGSRHIITHNVKDFVGSERLGVSAITPRDFLNTIRK